MMKTVFLLLFILLSTCFITAQSTFPDGEITYTCTNKNRQQESIPPLDVALTIAFKGTKSATSRHCHQFPLINATLLWDAATSDRSGILIHEGDRHVVMITASDKSKLELLQQKKQKLFTTTLFKDDKKTIVGYECYKVVASYKEEKITFYVSELLPPKSIPPTLLSPLFQHAIPDLKGMILGMETENQTMYASKISGEVLPDSLFEEKSYKLKLCKETLAHDEKALELSLDTLLHGQFLDAWQQYNQSADYRAEQANKLATLSDNPERMDIGKMVFKNLIAQWKAKGIHEEVLEEYLANWYPAYKPQAAYPILNWDYWEEMGGTAQMVIHETVDHYAWSTWRYKELCLQDWIESLVDNIVEKESLIRKMGYQEEDINAFMPDVPKKPAFSDGIISFKAQRSNSVDTYILSTLGLVTILPDEVTIRYKGNKNRVSNIVNGNVSNEIIVNPDGTATNFLLMDHKNKQYWKANSAELNSLCDYIDKMEQNRSSEPPTITHFYNRKKVICGYECYKVVISKSYYSTIVLYVSDQIQPIVSYPLCSSLLGIAGLSVSVMKDIKGGVLSAEYTDGSSFSKWYAVEVYPQSLDDGLFDAVVPEGYSTPVSKN